MAALVGETRSIKWFEPSMQTAPVSATVRITDPAGAVVSTPPDVTVTREATLLDTVDTTLEAIYRFLLPGVYCFQWMPVIGDAVPYWRQMIVSATSLDLNYEVRKLLGVTASELSDQDLDSNVVRTFLATLRVFATEVPTYSGLSASDAHLFDQGIALLTAASIRPAIAKGTPAGELVEITQGTDKYKFTNPFINPQKALDPIEMQWAAEASEMFGSIAAIATALEDAMADCTFVLAGRRRAARESYGLTTMPWYDLYCDAAMAWDWAAAYAEWSE